MLNPITLSQAIKDTFVDYVTTTFSIGDSEYAGLLEKELRKDDVIAKGPYIELNDAYKTGKTIRALIAEGVMSPLFNTLGRGFKLDRPLYVHQEEAVRAAVMGGNMIVSTGTGSGKTECFLMPIVNSLLKEIENNGQLDDGVRALVIYPMNALINDQAKRLRELFDGSNITFGIYNGNTEHSDDKGIENYKNTYGVDPLPNERVSREAMWRKPPHILITNYSMLEYMCIRPNDGAVFNNVKLKFVVLDEAHIYKGATGIEASMLLRRVETRLTKPNNSPQYILTSATLGDESDNPQILAFGENLCGHEFKSVIRSVPVIHKAPKRTKALTKDELLKLKDTPDNQLFKICNGSEQYHRIRKASDQPLTIAELAEKAGMEEDDLVCLIAACVRAKNSDGVPLVRARYHLFVRALEGAYITLTHPKRLFLTPTTETVDKRQVFECAVCADCGRIAVVGDVNKKTGKLEIAGRGENYSPKYFLLTDDDEFWEYTLCTKCRTISHYDGEDKYECDCGNKYGIKVVSADKNKERVGTYCPACDDGILHRFYLGGEDAAVVLATAVYENLPKDDDGKRQFLCFSDSRGDAAFFAPYLERSYNDILQKRGIWYVANLPRVKLTDKPWPLGAFADELARYFEYCETFIAPDKKQVPSVVCLRNAWIALLSEMQKSRRSDSLTSIGAISILPKCNNDNAIANFANKWGLPFDEAKTLLDLLLMDVVFHGAIQEPVDVRLGGEELETIFYSQYRKFVEKCNQGKDTNMGWLPKTRNNGAYYLNNRLLRLMSALGVDENDAYKMAGDYFDALISDKILKSPDSGKGRFISAEDFVVAIPNEVFVCDTCGRVTAMNFKNKCPYVRCKGTLNPIPPQTLQKNNYYASLYSKDDLSPFLIKEHTAQIKKDIARKYQEQFLEKNQRFKLFHHV